MTRKRIPRAQQYPWVVKLPKGARSPTDSIYERFDIVEQGKVLNTFADNALTVRSAAPFTLRIAVGKRVREIAAKKV